MYGADQTKLSLSVTVIENELLCVWMTRSAALSLPSALPDLKSLFSELTRRTAESSHRLADARHLTHFIRFQTRPGENTQTAVFKSVLSSVRQWKALACSAFIWIYKSKQVNISSMKTTQYTIASKCQTASGKWAAAFSTINGIYNWENAFLEGLTAVKAVENKDLLIC